MKALLLIVVAITTIVAGTTFAAHTTSQATAAKATGFTLCKSTYALCTTATCTRTAGYKGTLSCVCRVRSGYSAGTKACQAIHHTSAGTVIYSRYYPVKAYAVCSNARPWAWCLDAPCLIDKHDPSKAHCTCTEVESKKSYVIVTNAYTKATCSTGIKSSATVSGIRQISHFIKAEHLIPVLTTTVVNNPPPP